MIFKNKYLNIICSIFVLLMAGGCAEEDKPFDSPFIYLTDKFGGTSATMDSGAKYTSTYYMRLSSKTLTDELIVNYDLVVGEGLVKGLDYTIVDSTASPLKFKSGVYEKVIQVNWLPHAVISSKDNSLTISLTSTNQPEINLGRPGPGKLGSIYKITKE
jgi:hypothetical protein